jgi:hypothetical protein
MGRLSKDFPLQEEGLAFPTFTGTGSKECTAPTAGRISDILVPSVHIKLGIMKNFARVMKQTGPVFRYLAEKFPESVVLKSKRMFSLVPRSYPLQR